MFHQDINKVLATLEKVTVELDLVQEQQYDNAARFKQQANELEDKAQDATTTAIRAQRVKSKLQELLS